MDSDFDAQKDLDLGEEDAEGVVGGHMNSREGVVGEEARGAFAPAITSFVVSGSTLSGDPGCLSGRVRGGARVRPRLLTAQPGRTQRPSGAPGAGAARRPRPPGDIRAAAPG